MTNIITKIALSAIAFGTIAMGGPANAATVDAQGNRIIEISTKGIDLKSPEGLARIERLTHSAAVQVCGVGNGTDLTTVMAENACFKRAMADVDKQIAMIRNTTQVALLKVR